MKNLAKTSDQVCNEAALAPIEVSGQIRMTEIGQKRTLFPFFQKMLIVCALLFAIVFEGNSQMLFPVSYTVQTGTTSNYIMATWPTYTVNRGSKGAQVRDANGVLIPGRYYWPVTWSSPGTYTLCLLQGGQCVAGYTYTITVADLVGPVSLSAVSPATTSMCNNQTTSTYSASAFAATDFGWSITPTTAGTMARYGTNNSQCTVTWNSSFAGTATIQATGTNSVSVNSNTISITRIAMSTFNPAQITFPTGAVCATSPLGFNVWSYTDPANAWHKAKFEWNIPDDGTIRYTTAYANSSTYSPSGADVAGHSVRVVITPDASNQCLTSYNSTTRQVYAGTNYPNYVIKPVVDIVSMGWNGGAGNSRCKGPGTSQFSATTTDETSRSWSIYSASGTAGSISSTGLVTWDPNFTGTSTITFTANGCGGSSDQSSMVITVTAAPPSPTVTATVSQSCGSTVTTFTASGRAPSGETYQWYTTLTGGTAFSSADQLPNEGISATTTFYVSIRNTASGCESVTRTPITVTIAPILNDITLIGGGTYITAPSGQHITTASSQIGVRYQLRRNGVNYGAYQSNATGAGLLWTNLPRGIYTLEAYYASGIPCNKIMPGQITITLQEPVAVASKTVLPYADFATVTTTASYATYQWMRNGVDITTGGNVRTININRPGAYQVKVQEPLGEEVLSTIAYVYAPFEAPAPIGGPDQGGFNAVSTTNILIEGLKDFNSVYDLNLLQTRQQIVYRDGLGRPYQVVQMGQSPTGNDLVQAVGYSQYGLAEKKFLPYEGNSRDGRPRFNAIEDAGGSYTNSEQYAFYQNASRTAHDLNPFALTKLADSPLGNVKEQGAPGTDWQPGAHAIKNDFLANVTSQVRNWKPDGTTAGYYNANEIAVQQITDENGNKVRTFTDKLGRTVLKQVQLDETVQGLVTPWLETYYIYDIFGNLIYQVPPKAMAVLGTGTSLDAKNLLVAELIFKNTYDTRGRLVEKKVPGAVPQFYVYDKYDRIILTQDGNLRNQSKWLFAKYDSKDRPVMMGLYTNTTEVTRTAMQGYVDAQFPGPVFFESRGTTLEGYTNVSFPTINRTATPLEVFSVNYYDNYDFDFNGTDDYSYTVQGLAGEGTQGNAYNLPTGGKRLQLGTSTWLYNYVFYDEWGRTIQARSNNHLSAAVDNLTTMVYDFEGKVLCTKEYHNAGGANQTTTVTKYLYHFTSRLERVTQMVNNGPERVLAWYRYNALGQLIEKNLHCTDCTDPLLSQPNTGTGDVLQRSAYSATEKNLVATQSITLSPGYMVPAGSTLSARVTPQSATIPLGGGAYAQSIDYRYNIRGWLTSINNAELADDSGIGLESTNDDATDYFGMNLLYNKDDTGLGSTGKFNGNVSAIKWKGAGDLAGPRGGRAYKYTYDKTDRLKNAEFKAYGTTQWDKELNTLNEDMTYDANGNILTLQRKNVERTILSNFTPSSIAQVMDNLTYTYASNTNKLNKVEDSATQPGGFVNGETAAALEYNYNTDGSITEDKNKKILTITYNALGKPAQMTFADGRIVAYTYDAAGTKLRMAVTVSGVTTTTDYVGKYVYQNNSLQFFSSPEGRVVKKGGNYEYEYAISDHQGNTRVVFAAYAQPADTYTATYETNTLATEVTTFQNYPSGAWRSALNLYDHTDTGTTATYSQLLNGAANGQVGLAKTLKVFPGDVIRADVYAKYFNPTSTASNMAGFATALTAAFGLSPASVGDGLKAFQGLSDFGSVIVANNGSPSAGGPKAFITILQFDQEFNFVNAAWDQISATAQETGSNVPHDLMTQQVTIKEPGYVYIYVSNENPTLVDVYFDDLTITHTKTPVIQSNEYYPFGLQTANSWTRESVTTNNFLYNEGTELNSTTGMYDLFYRNYDPALGRFHQVDPMAGMYGSQTPYNYGNNNPITFNDPMGDYSASTQVNQVGIDGSAGNGYGNSLLGGFSSLFDSYTGGYFTHSFGAGYGKAGLSSASFQAADGYFQSQALQSILPTAAAINTNKPGNPIDYGPKISAPVWIRNVWAGKQKLSGKNAGKYEGAWQAFDHSLMDLMISKGYDIELSLDQQSPDAKFYYDAIDGMKLNDGTILSRSDVVFSFNSMVRDSKTGNLLRADNANYLGKINGKYHINFNIEDYEVTKANIRTVANHEIFGHGINEWDSRSLHYKAYFANIDSQYWSATTLGFKEHTAAALWQTWTAAGKYYGMPSKYMNVINQYYKR